jgi:hypothetical protein
MQPVRQQAEIGVVDRDGRLIAGTFNADYTHKNPVNPLLMTLKSQLLTLAPQTRAPFAFYGGAL